MDAKAIALGVLAVMVGLAVASLARGFAGSKAGVRL
jgi:hypothetical protein